MAYPFAAAEVLTAANLNAMIGAPTQNAQTGVTYTLALLDAGKTVTFSNAAAVAVTLPLQATVSWADNTQLNLLNLGAGTVTIAGAVGVTINGTPLTLATSKGGSLIRTASNTWTFVPSGGGKILQVVSADYAVQTLTTSASYVTSGLTASITPSLTTSKVIIFATTSGVHTGTTGTGYYSLFRGTAAGTNIGPEVSAFGSASDVYWAMNITGIDSPSTTSAQVYTLCMKVASSNQVGAQLGNVKAQMILMEVSA